MKKIHPVKKFLLTLLLVVGVGLPCLAVFKEKDINKTLSVLHYELRSTYQTLLRSTESITENQQKQHRQLVRLIENCNELSVMLYSQQQDFTFDVTYALNEVTKQYAAFNNNRLPYDIILANQETDVDRYEKLVASLLALPPRKQSEDVPPGHFEVLDTNTATILDTLLALETMQEEVAPFQLDSLGQAERDSCLAYAQEILDLYWETLFMIDEDNTYYSQTDNHLKEAYNYAQERYRSLQKSIFIDGQNSFPKTLSTIQRALRKASRDCIKKYSEPKTAGFTSEWRGPMVTGFMALMLVLLVVSTILGNILVRSLLKRVKFLQSHWFKSHKFIFLLLGGSIIFVIVIWILKITTSQNFMKMACSLILQYAWLLIAILLSLLARLSGEESRHALSAYFPMMLIAFLIIGFRIVFIPNSLIVLIFPPLLLIVTIWQGWISIIKTRPLPKVDRLLMWLSFLALLICTIVSWAGYCMLALVIAVWWTFQLTVILFLNAIHHLLRRYWLTHVKKRVAMYKEKNPYLPAGKDGSFIEISWLYDFVYMALLPILSIWSVPVCIYMAGQVFDLSSILVNFFNKPFLNVDKVIHLSAFKLAVVITLYFLTRYLVYLTKAAWRVYKTKQAIAKLPDGRMFNETDINFSLSDNIISLLGWGIFVIASFVLMRIPTSAITIVSTGLATGIGFAMKDVLNNFFYGVQLMSGRIRVGDIIECDGIRGKVESMSYQSTQIISVDGSVMAFPNSTLFAKNFKNLTRNHSYELLQIPVGVKYGTDVDFVRKILVDALQVLCVKDEYGRDIVDPAHGIIVRFSGFGDNSVDLIVQQFTTVETHYSYAAQAKEVIYNALNKNGIEIPFPQRDLYVKTMPSVTVPSSPEKGKE